MTLSKGEIPDMWSGETSIKQSDYQSTRPSNDWAGCWVSAADMHKSFRKETNLNKEENNMNTRKIVNIHLIDDSLGLPVEKSIVAIYEGIVTEDSQEVTIQQLLMDKDVKGAIAAHNEARTNIVDNAILERTGNSVMLRPITLKDLRWDVK